MKTQEAEIPITECLNSLTNPIFVTDYNGLIANCNKAAGKLLLIPPEILLHQPIDKFLIVKNTTSVLSDTIKLLTETKSLVLERMAKKTEGSEEKIRILVSALQNKKDEIVGAVFSIQENMSSILLSQLEYINQTLAKLSDNYFENINLITRLCGEMLGASSALYNRLNDGLLCSYGKWNTANDHIPVVNPEGRICYDVIKKAENDVYFISNLPQSSYAKSDPNVNQYNLKAYVGHMVKCNSEPVGSLCAVFQHEFEFTDFERYIINRLAIAIEAEETSESLRKSKKRYRELFDFAVEGILIASPEGIITDSNNSIFTMTGFREDELVGMSISEVLVTNESFDTKPFRFDLLKLGQLVINERDILCKDGHIITVEMHSKMLPDYTFQTVMFDITESKATAKKLRLSENTYRGIINSLNDAIYILDKEACFVDVNLAAEKFYGYKKENFIGKNPGFLSAPGLNDMDDTIKQIGSAYEGISGRFEFWGLRKDGSIFLKEVSLSPGMWFDQKVVIAVGREMTERKRIEESLKISEEKYRMLVQYSSDPIFSFNPDESYRFVNDAFATPFGKKPHEIIGKTPYDIFPAEEAEKRLRLVRKVFSTGEKGEIEVKVINSNKEENFYLTLVDPIKDTTGNIMWVTCISKDITQRKKAEEELKLKNEQLNASNAEKDKFFSIVAHDLRGPMNGFLGLTSVMADDIESLSAEELKEIATTMRTSAVNIYRLIENLLEWSKMQRGLLSFEPQPLFLKSALTKSIELMMDTANKKGIVLLIKIPEHTVVVADIHMLETIIRNLISNALKFSFKGGVVEISAIKAENNMIHIRVKDSGIGMNAELINKLFTLTENISRKGTEGEPSTGLGLILCKEFVEKQGGEIWAEGKDGEGSSFIFSLPQM